ncbi:abortive infection family protein [uncultured Tateyamaria sp.]|uniref:abortive infection family protein n=1 Tax=uncultured Tateyamaria sp. TaxID=455651 RepID=UPI00263010A9|nr:abortive infection family protein [uncultured Tateyamaria sp.]
MEKELIPLSIVGLLSRELSDLFTHAEIDRIFTYADAPGDPPEGSKAAKINDWLRGTNKASDRPLNVLGTILEEILEHEFDDPDWLSPYEEKWKTVASKIEKALAQKNLTYSSGGRLTKSGAVPTRSLIERVAADGLTSVQIEIDRALALVSDDPNGAAQYAGNVLEAVTKHYLVARNISFSEKNSKLTDLWSLVRNDLGLNPKDLAAKDLKKIATGLGSIVDGTMYLRDKRSGAHGRTQQQVVINAIRPRHARLVIHSAHTLAIYIIECLDG